MQHIVYFHRLFGRFMQMSVHVALVAMVLAWPRQGWAHGFVGDRFFPPTIQTDDPFATDEFSVSVQSFKNYGGSAPGGFSTRELDVTTEFDKEIFPKFALGISDTYSNQMPDANFGANSASGFQNLSLSAKYQLWQDDPHEWIFSVGGEISLGGTSDKALGDPAETNTFSTYTPDLYFGKGFGDLPDALKYLKPFALTGTVGYDIPSEGGDQGVLNWGFALEYSLPYLQQHVEDIGIPAPFRDLIPLVEFTQGTPTNANGGNATTTTGTVDPGVLWEGKYCQIGAEAVIPTSNASGPDIGAVFSVQIYIDDLFPKVFGHPLFGKDSQ